ncbi:MAG: helix-hairpin-helix domain-containing protein [Chlorobi bacterium]|nr:helix-hairpin-helix domain-containing protein [Chlorobiota bacterium]
MWKDWLALSKREQKGFIVLSIVLFMLIVFYLLIPLFYSGEQCEPEDPEFVAWLDSMNKLNEQITTVSDSFFDFDPNTVSISRLEKLGVKGRALINWLKLRESGYRFRSSGDIRKIYYLDSILAESLMCYVRIDTTLKSRYRKQHSYKKGYGNHIVKAGSFNNPKKRYFEKAEVKEEDFKIEINTADTSEFSVLKGIGKVLSARIVSYRTVLGGYYSVEQLKEVYGMPQETVDKNKKYLTVDTSLLRKINVNRSSLRRLKNHPYIDFYLARAIVEYRRKKGKIESIDEVLSLKEAKDKDKSKLAVYLSVK